MKTLRLSLFCLIAVCAWGQKQPTPLSETHVRVWAIDRVITRADGIRMPAHMETSGKLGFVAVYSKDGQYALVEYVAASEQDHTELRRAAAAHRDPRVRVMDKARTKREDFEAAALAAGFSESDFKRMFVNVR